MSLYKESWLLYKSLTEDVNFDIDYYQSLIKGRTLELFAGFGRVVNRLENKENIIAVELEEQFIPYIQLPSDKIYCGNVLDISSNKFGKFDTIFAAYNSFCLLTEHKDIDLFFAMLASVLSDNGKISLSYSDHTKWEVEEGFIELDNKNYKYNSEFTIQTDKGTWVDIFTDEKGNIYKHTYPVKFYNSIDELNLFSQKHGLVVTEVVEHKHYEEAGWKDFILEKAF